MCVKLLYLISFNGDEEDTLGLNWGSNFPKVEQSKLSVIVHFYYNQPFSTTLICAIRLPHAYLLTFHAILNT